MLAQLVSAAIWAVLIVSAVWALTLLGSRGR